MTAPLQGSGQEERLEKISRASWIRGNSAYSRTCKACYNRISFFEDLVSSDKADVELKHIGERDFI